MSDRTGRLVRGADYRVPLSWVDGKWRASHFAGGSWLNAYTWRDVAHWRGAQWRGATKEHDGVPPWTMQACVLP